ncbi:MAG: hypothetical protein GY913_18945 [Proteobacteria bacterium]|nr:hypothetical protein [Pseudomonadota bacterium]
MLLTTLIAATASASELTASDTFIVKPTVLADYTADAVKTPRRRSPLLAAGLNWVLPGTGYLYNGERPGLGATLAVGAVGLTVVEQSHAFFGEGLKTYDPMLFNLMFASVLVMNTGLAVDAFVEARAINDRNGHERKRQVTLAPSMLPGNDDELAYGFVVSVR